ncbi:hypothetical protein GW17_00047214 [Ensete ventricosum]|nr:hypothetical protein GW17_00047214 [Ensete ventricosum]
MKLPVCTSSPLRSSDVVPWYRPVVEILMGWSAYRARSVMPLAARWRGCRWLVGSLRLLCHAADPLSCYRSSAVKRAANQVGTLTLPARLTKGHVDT